jgi:glyoxylase-like metal-dependent hydrolase (beta-lactamase superfamily II)
VSFEQVTEHVIRIPMGDSSMFMIVRPDGLTLVDTGFPGSMPEVRAALAALGRRPTEIVDILVTHCHPDHAGGLKEIKEATGARAWMHPADAEMAREGRFFRPWKPAPGAEKEARARDVISLAPQTTAPVEVDEEARPGERIPVAGGVDVIGTPGHTLGHVVYLWSGDGGVIFLGDAAENRQGIDSATIYEDYEAGVRSLRSLAGLDFDVACFAHGTPIVGDAARAFKQVLGEA